MVMSTRRTVLLGTAAAAVVLLGLSQFSFSLTPPEFFSQKQKVGTVSFGEASKLLREILAKEIELSQTDFGVKYTEADINRIHVRVWDQAQLALSESYAATEEAPPTVGGPSPNRPPPR